MEKQSTAGFWLSPQQKHVWLWQQQKPQNSVCVVRWEGPLRESALRAAIEKIVSRHEILRTVFVRQPGMKVPFQVIQEKLEPAWESVDLKGLNPEQQSERLDRIFAAEQGRVFNLESGPMLQITLAQMRSEER